MKRLCNLLIIVAFLFTACQKELTDPLTPQVTTIADSNYISMVVDVDTSVSPADSFFRVKYTYDNLKRVVHINVDDEQDLYDRDYRFFYNNNDQLPYKATDNNDSGFNGGLSVTYLTYDAQGQKLKDSTIKDYSSYREKTIKSYTYSNGMIVSKAVFNQLNTLTNTTSVQIINDTVMIDASGNSVSGKSYFEDLSVPKYLRDAFSATYDNKQSPFSKLNILPVYSPYVGEAGVELSYFMNGLKYNMLSSSGLIRNGAAVTPPDFQKQENLIFNGFALPVRSTISLYTQGTLDFRFVRHYFYTAL